MTVPWALICRAMRGSRMRRRYSSGSLRLGGRQQRAAIEAGQPRDAVTWAAVDRAVTYAAPWVTLANLNNADFLSARVASETQLLATDPSCRPSGGAAQWQKCVTCWAAAPCRRSSG